MIEFLEHKLIQFDSKILIYQPHRFLSYKCINCNHILFCNIRNSIYWKYPDGSDFKIENGYGNWNYIELTCSEEIIKGLLE